MSIFLAFIKKLYYKSLSNVSLAKKKGVKVGENCFIGIREWPSEPYLISIGNNVGIASGAKLHTHGGARVARLKYPNYDVFGKITIKDNVYIGSGAQIMPGVTIGEGSLISAGAIVTHSVPNNQVWGGNPAKFICTVEEYINRNLPFNVNTKKLNPKQKQNFLLSLPENKFIKK